MSSALEPIYLLMEAVRRNTKPLGVRMVHFVLEPGDTPGIDDIVKMVFEVDPSVIVSEAATEQKEYDDKFDDLVRDLDFTSLPKEIAELKDKLWSDDEPEG